MLNSTRLQILEYFVVFLKKYKRGQESFYLTTLQL